MSEFKKTTKKALLPTSKKSSAVQKKKTSFSTKSNNILMLQKRVGNQAMQQLFKTEVIQKQENKTGLPENLKDGIESLSGYNMDDVKIHYNSSQPAQFNAFAFTKGSDIHLASGAERYLPHEAWHVVQQKQGRVQPTRQLKGNLNINDDELLEKEADEMGEMAFNTKTIIEKNNYYGKALEKNILQRKIKSNTQRKINKNSITDTISLEFSKEVTAKYAKVNISGTIALSVQFVVYKSEINADTSIEEGKDSINFERSITLYEAKEEGKRKAKKMISDKIDKGNFFKIDKVEAILQEEQKDNEVSNAIGIKLIFTKPYKGEFLIKFNTFSIDREGKKIVAGLNFEYTQPFSSTKLWERDSMSLTGTGNVKFLGGVQPNWSVILKKLAPYLKQGKSMLRAFLSTLTIEGLIATGFILGGVTTLFSAYAMIQDIDDIESYVKKAKAALSDFVTGYCRAFGINAISFGGSLQAFSNGENMAHNDLQKIIQLIQTNPQFSFYNFTTEELASGIIDNIQQHSKELYSSVFNYSKQRIYKAYLLAFYEKKKAESWGIAESKEDFAYREAKHVAYRLGLSPSLLPKPSWSQETKEDK